MSGAAPLTVSFSDMSENTPRSWFWSFGDGENSKAQNPTHTYTARGSYTVTLAVSNRAGADTLSRARRIDVAAAGQGIANRDIEVMGTHGGDYCATHESDDIYEEESQGNPVERQSGLEHKWTMHVPPGNEISLHLEARHSANAEGDDFIFAYSEDDTIYSDLLVVTKTVDDDTTQRGLLPLWIQGPIYVRVRDADRTPGRLERDQVYIDMMIVESSTAPDSMPPVISGLTIIEVTQSSACIVWETNECSTSIVCFDTESGPVYQFAVSGGERVLEHRVMLDGLSAATRYYFIVESADGSENAMVSGEQEFMTEAEGPEISPLSHGSRGLARAVALHECYPNPIVAETNIRFDLPAECRMTLQVFDIAGRPVHTLIDSRVQPAGRHLIVWDGRRADASRISRGLYFLQLRAGNVTARTRLALLD